jgi:hypothetical protein
MESFSYVIKYKKVKDNVVVNALSYKNTMLLTRVEINVLRLDEIKDLYPLNDFFGTIFTKCSTERGFDDFYLLKGFKQDKICIPTPSLRVLLQEAHGGALIGYFVVMKHILCSRRTTIVPR